MAHDPFVGIEYRDTFIGRQPFVKGSGMAAWEFIMVAKGFDLDAEKTADYLQCPVSDVQAALNYYEAHREEIDQALAENEIGEEGLRRMFSNLQVFEFSLTP